MPTSAMLHISSSLLGALRSWPWFACPPLDFKRDYILPLPEAGWEGVVARAASHSDALAIYHTFLEDLRAPTYVNKSGHVAWSEFPRLLVPIGMGRCMVAALVP